MATKMLKKSLEKNKTKIVQSPNMLELMLLSPKQCINREVITCRNLRDYQACERIEYIWNSLCNEDITLIPGRMGGREPTQ